MAMPSWYLRQGARFQGPAFPLPPLLDTLSATAIVAYSTRKLRAGYAGNALKATTSASGNATQDIGFTAGGDLDTSSGSGLNTFIGSNTGSIATWYDQSGNNNNATNSTVSQQPIIVSSGVNVTQNGHVWSQSTFAAVTGLLLTGISFALPVTVAALFKFDSVTSTNAIIFDGVSSMVAFQTGSSPNFFLQIQDGSVLASTIPADTSVHTGVAIFNGVSSQFIIDGTAIATGNTGSSVISPKTGIFGGSGQGKVAEVLYFNSVLGSTDISSIRSSWQSYWGAP